jgi:flagellar biosynthesis protein FlhG
MTTANGALRGTMSLAITGSKGGVGKSNLALNLAVVLQRFGRRVLLMDGDLGLASLDILLGLAPKHTIEHLLCGGVGLDETLLEGPDGIRLLPAASGLPHLARLDAATRGRLLSIFAQTGALADTVVVDTGAGLSAATLALQRAASRVIVVTTPEPTALVDAYANLKVLWDADPDKPADLVVNAVESEAEGSRVHRQLERAAKALLGRAPGFLGSVARDRHVQDSVRQQRALLQAYPSSAAARCYERIALRILAGDAAARGEESYWDRLLATPTPGVPQ